MWMIPLALIASCVSAAGETVWSVEDGWLVARDGDSTFLAPGEGRAWDLEFGGSTPAFSAKPSIAQSAEAGGHANMPVRTAS